ncbi:MAG: TetR/AcrR family transcriptional regulator [Roseibium sp.]|uniref:TetR/AcrR family transcriptional regulator n=1 Tax=Roseibium sp. TaxID=1936156 RepID=UPI001B2E9D52|nr:TetR/AcrR family transcriptional regulator [Roseibium sp.]MBO6892157.1 TetR/AcrR family transcriptional regulator [Roseibium sp.]
MTKRKRFDKTDWISLGLAQLAREGGSGLTVEALCRQADRTRGSFYHHFADHSAFIEAIMAAWKQRNTIDVAEETLKADQGSRAQQLSALANNLDLDLERAVRQFAQANVIAHQTLREVDELRTEFVAGLYRQDGLSADKAREIAMIEYAAYVGSQIVWPEMAASERMKLDRQFASLVRLLKDSNA